MEKFVVGQDMVVWGRWMQVEEVSEDGQECFAVDQEGESHEIDMSCVDHFYD